jgi:hypothetical protein
VEVTAELDSAHYFTLLGIVLVATLIPLGILLLRADEELPVL